MGVLTTVTVREGKTFGPIPPNLTLSNPTTLIGHMTSDNRPDVHTVKIDIHEYASGPRLAEWIPYIQAARDEQEQNMEALIQNGQLYYRIQRTIQPHEELLVWYTEDLAQIVGVPQLSEVHYNDNGTYCCPYCAQNFRYPHSLRAHMRFKCETLKKAMHMDTAPFRSSMEYRVPFSMYSQPTATVGNPKNISPSGSVYSQSTSSAGSAKDLSPSGSVTSTTSSLDSLSPPRYSSSPDVLSDGKRSHKRFRSGTDADTSGERFSNPSPGSQHASDDPDMRSAFRKVARHGSEPRAQPDVVSATSALIKSHHLGLLPSLPFNSVKASAIPLGIGSLPARFPLPITDPSLISPLSVARLHNANIPLSTAESNMKNAEYGRLNDKLMDIRNMENNNMYDKLSMLPQRRVGFCPSLFKSNNPMVDKIIHHNMHIPSSLTSFSLAQNWCAKCNTTFRMTSDLVYHMRSHHKQGFDPLKRKREEKLRCDVCGETFKERHHLSRHMTSHM